jgi:hypothetical protein
MATATRSAREASEHRSTLIVVALLVAAVFGALVFFAKNPFRVGEIAIGTPNGSSVLKIKVADGDNVSELIRKGLNGSTGEALRPRAKIT